MAFTEYLDTHLSKYDSDYGNSRDRKSLLQNCIRKLDGESGENPTVVRGNIEKKLAALQRLPSAKLATIKVKGFEEIITAYDAKVRAGESPNQTKDNVTKPAQQQK